MLKQLFIFLSFVSFLNIKSEDSIVLEDSNQADVYNFFHEERLHVITPAFQNPIHPKDLADDANPQYTIRASGRYYISGNLIQEHNTAAGIVLLVNTNNVSLNLNGKTIAPHVSGSLATGTAIAVAAGTSNTSIMNGSIVGCDSSDTVKINKGIDIGETSVSGGSGTCYGLVLSNIRLLKVRKQSVNIDTCNDIFMYDISANDSSDTTSGTHQIIYLTTCKNIKMSDIEVNKNSSSSSDLYCLAFNACSNGIVENAMVGSNSNASNFVSVQISTVDNFLFKNLNSSNNTSSNGGARGVWMQNSPLNVFEDCKFNGNYSTQSSGVGYGFQVQDSGSVDSSNCKFIRCSFNGNYSTGSSGKSYGLYIYKHSGGGAPSSNNDFLDCTFNGNNGAGNGVVSGVYLDDSSGYNDFVNCSFNGNFNTTTSAHSSANVYGVYSTGDLNSFVNCSAIGNATSSNSTVSAVGFYSTAGANNKFENCVASGNNASHTTASVKSAGFLFNGAETRSQIVNCQVNANYVGDGSSSGSGARSYGIYFDSTTGADQCLIKNCVIENNHKGLSGSGLAFGFYDNDTASTSVLVGNVVVGHGKCLGSALDANIQWNGNSEPAASQNFFFKHSGIDDDPRGAIREVPRESFITLSTSVLKWQNISVYDAS